MAMIVVNGVRREVQAPADTPLLYVLRNDLELTGPQFGCGLAQCGSCSVLLDGKEIRSCITALSAAVGKEVTTLEGLPGRWAQQKGISPAEAEKTLQSLRRRARGEGYRGYELRAELALGSVQMSSSRKMARERLVKLQSDAQANGFLFIARKARAALQDASSNP